MKINDHRFNKFNERIKYKYKEYLKYASQKDYKTIEITLRHLRDFEVELNFENLETYNKHKAGPFIKNMESKGFSLTYQSACLRSLRKFYCWLIEEPGYRIKIRRNDIDYLNLTHKQEREARSLNYWPEYSFEQIIQSIRKMPDGTKIQQRNKAMISLCALCGLRVSELRTVKLGNLYSEDGIDFVNVSPKTMTVKFSKQREAFFLRLPADIRDNVINWHQYLISQHFGGNDPLFPKVENNFVLADLIDKPLTKNMIQSEVTIRKIFSDAFKSAGLEYFRPHSFRATIAKYAQKQTPELFNAVSQNLGHSNIHVTYGSYARLSRDERKHIISSTVIQNTANEPFFSNGIERPCIVKDNFALPKHSFAALS